MGEASPPRIPRRGGTPIVDDSEKDVDLRLMAQYVVSDGDNIQYPLGVAYLQMDGRPRFGK